jgi:chromate reductase, NAD(P)H dehydrogenase (quinone)
MPRRTPPNPKHEPMKSPRILAFGGSLRAGSYNQMAAALASDGAYAAGADVTLVALRDYRMPLFDADFEDAEGMPEPAREFKSLLAHHDGWIIGCPEYNSGITGALKNAIDWASREESGNEPPLSAFRGKTAVILSASPGELGGMRGLVQVRAILNNIGVNVLPTQVSIPRAHKLFDETGLLTDEKYSARVRDLGAQLAGHLEKLIN